MSLKSCNNNLIPLSSLLDYWSFIAHSCVARPADNQGGASVANEILTVDLGSASIKAGFFDRRQRKCRPVMFGDAFSIPTVFYISGDESSSLLCGYDALNAGLEDPKGIHFGLLSELPDRYIDKEITFVHLVRTVLTKVKKYAEDQFPEMQGVDSVSIVSSEEFVAEKNHILQKGSVQAGLDLVGVYAAPKAISRYCEYNYELDGPVILVDLGSDGTRLELLDVTDDDVRMSTTIQEGGKLLDQMLVKRVVGQETLTTDRLGLLEGDLRYRKQEVVASGDIYQGGFGGLAYELSPLQVKDAINELLTELSMRIGQFMGMCRKHHRIKNEMMVILAGGLSAYPGMQEEIERYLDSTVAVVEVPEVAAVMGASLPIGVTDPSHVAQEIKPGTIFNEYRIERLIGRGGMGNVWLAHHMSLGRNVALKILHDHLLRDESAVQRFLQEMKNTARLEHPNIITAYDAGNMNGMLYLVNNYIEGVELADILRQDGLIDEHYALRVAKKVGVALRYAWNEHKMLHRDIKPDNIMVTSNGDVFLMDLGISKSLLEKNGSVTHDNAIVGTPYYMSPEQIHGDDCDSRADIYSLGATLYHLVTGELPFQAETVMGVIEKQLNDPLPSPSERNPKLRREVVELIEKMMQKDPSLRHADWEDVIADISHILGEETSLDSAPTGLTISLENYRRLLRQGRASTESTVATLMPALEDSPFQAIYHMIKHIIKKKTGATFYMVMFTLLLMLTAVGYGGHMVYQMFSKVDLRVNGLLPQAKVTVVDLSDSRVVSPYDQLNLADGKLSLRRGKYKVRVELPLYESVVSEFEVVDSEQSLDLNMVREQGLVTVKTLPLADIQIMPLEDQGNEMKERADIDGIFSTTLPSGKYRVVSGGRFYSLETGRLILSPPESVITLKGMELQSGCLRVQTVEGAEIYQNGLLIGKSAEPLILGVGEHSLEVKGKGFKSRTFRVKLVDGAPGQSVELELEELKGLLRFAIALNSGSVLPEGSRWRIGQEQWQPLEINNSQLVQAEISQYLEIEIPGMKVLEGALTNFTVDPDGEKTFLFNAEQEPSVVVIQADEPLTIFLKGKELGASGEPIEFSRNGEVELTLKRPGYIDQKFKVTLKPGQQQRFIAPQMTLLPGSIEVSVALSPDFKLLKELDCSGFIQIGEGNWEAVKYPVKSLKVPAGPIKLSFKVDDFDLAQPSLELEIPSRGHKKVELQLIPKPSEVSIACNVGNAILSTISGEIIGNVSTPFKIRPGEDQTFIIQAAGYKPKTFKVPVKDFKARRYRVSVNLESAN